MFEKDALNLSRLLYRGAASSECQSATFTMTPPLNVILSPEPRAVQKLFVITFRPARGENASQEDECWMTVLTISIYGASQRRGQLIALDDRGAPDGSSRRIHLQ